MQRVVVKGMELLPLPRAAPAVPGGLPPPPTRHPPSREFPLQEELGRASGGDIRCHRGSTQWKRQLTDPVRRWILAPAKADTVALAYGHGQREHVS